jgi:hypothetical protein
MAKHVKSEMALEYHLAKASEGIDLTVMGVLRFQFMTGEDEECNPTMGLYLYNPEDLSYPPVPVAKFFDMFFIK